MAGEARIIQNPPNPFIFWGIVGLSPIPLVLGLMAWDIGGGYGVLGLVLLILFVGQVFGAFFLEYYHKPQGIEVNDDGLVLRFRYSDPLDVAYGDIKWVTMPKTNDPGNGTMGVKGRFQFSMEYSACRAIRAAYSEHVGTVPRSFPSWAGGK